jgi:hypothetical protein
MAIALALRHIIRETVHRVRGIVAEEELLLVASPSIIVLGVMPYVRCSTSASVNMGLQKSLFQVRLHGVVQLNTADLPEDTARHGAGVPLTTG